MFGQSTNNYSIPAQYSDQSDYSIVPRLCLAGKVWRGRGDGEGAKRLDWLRKGFGGRVLVSRALSQHTASHERVFSDARGVCRRCAFTNFLLLPQGARVRRARGIFVFPLCVCSLTSGRPLRTKYAPLYPFIGYASYPARGACARACVALAGPSNPSRCVRN